DKMATFVTMVAPKTLDNAIMYVRKVEAGDYYGQQAAVHQAPVKIESDMKNLYEKKNYTTLKIPTSNMTQKEEVNHPKILKVIGKPKEKRSGPCPPKDSTNLSCKRGPSIVDKIELYDIANDLLAAKSNAMFGQLLQYPNQKRNLARALRRPPHTKEANLVDPQPQQQTTAAKCHMYITDEPVVAVLDTSVVISIITKRLADQLGIRIEKESKMVVVTATGTRKCTLGSIAKVNINVNGVNIPTYLQVLESKEYVNEDVRSGDHDGVKNDNDNLFEEFEYEIKDLEEVESYFTDSIPVGEVSDNESEERIDNKNVEDKSPAVCLAVMEEVPTEKKVLVDEKLPQLFKENKDLFANGLEELGQTNLVKHVIKT
ncbi:12367_t:CDS:2, partial [Cetraspora pellucida]